MNTEITDYKVSATTGWIFFDAECRFCVAGRRRWGKVFERRGYVWRPLQTPGIASRLGVTEEQLMAEMWVLPTGGRPLNGVSAWIELMRRVWWLWPIAMLLALPVINSIGQVVYRWIARNRYCLAGRREVGTKRATGLRPHDLLLLAALIVAIIEFTWRWPGWVLMWTLGVALGQFGKWLTWRDAREAGLSTPAKLSLVWFLFWPGLDGRTFFARNPIVPCPAKREWLAASIKLAFGVALIWMMTPLARNRSELLAAWVAMIGIVLCLHFGLFQLLSLGWRTIGVNAQPIMNRPLVATSLAEFWGERWNTAFSIPSRRLLFNPLARRHGIVGANLAVFLASGVLHELVISLPARAGFGLPTAYFALQGVAVLFERSKLGRALGFGRGWRGWTFVFVVAAAPVFWLFHPPFIHSVILPMLQAIGATGGTP